MKLLKKICIAVIIISLVAIISVNSLIKNDTNFIVKEWNNIYNTNSINFYYEDIENTKLQSLEQVYKIKEITNSEELELDKANKILQIANTIVSYDDVPNSKHNNAYDILKEKKDSRKVSKRDMAIITKDMLTSIGLMARIGEFRNPVSKIENQENYYVVEYYSNKFSKWVMLDYIDRGYFLKNDIPLSAIELFGENIELLQYKGQRDKKEYFKILKPYLKTYSIWIDNTIEMERSNTQLTYIKKEKYITLDFKNTFLPPTIFTQNVELFNKPLNDYSIEGEDRAYIVLMKKEEVKKEVTEENSEKTIDFIVGAYKDDKILTNYYVKVNEEEYKPAVRYSDLKLRKGVNIVEISINGVDSTSSVIIEVRK